MKFNKPKLFLTIALCSLFFIKANAQNFEDVAVLSVKLNQSYYETNGLGKLLFLYNEKYSGGTLDYKVYNQDREDITPPILNKMSSPGTGSIKDLGDNIYELDVLNNGDFIYKDFYVLEVDDGKGKTLKLRFRCLANKPPDSIPGGGEN